MLIPSHAYLGNWWLFDEPSLLYERNCIILLSHQRFDPQLHISITGGWLISLLNIYRRKNNKNQIIKIKELFNVSHCDVWKLIWCEFTKVVFTLLFQYVFSIYSFTLCWNAVLCIRNVKKMSKCICKLFVLLCSFVCSYEQIRSMKTTKIVFRSIKTIKDTFVCCFATIHFTKLSRLRNVP